MTYLMDHHFVSYNHDFSITGSAYFLNWNVYGSHHVRSPKFEIGTMKRTLIDFSKLPKAAFLHTSSFSNADDCKGTVPSGLTGWQCIDIELLTGSFNGNMFSLPLWHIHTHLTSYDNLFPILWEKRRCNKPLHTLVPITTHGTTNQDTLMNLIYTFSA